MSFLVRTLSVCLVFTIMFLSVSPFSPSLVAMSSLAPSGVHRVNRWAEKAEQRLENFYYEALASSRHDINLEFDEENLKPDRLTKAPGYASIDPSTMRISKWYHSRERTYWSRENVIPSKHYKNPIQSRKKMPGATSDDDFSQACSIIFNNMGAFNRKNDQRT